MYQRFGPYKIEMTGLSSKIVTTAPPAYGGEAEHPGRLDAVELMSATRTFRFTPGSPGFAEALAWHQSDDTADDGTSDIFEAWFDLLDDMRTFMGRHAGKPTITPTGPTVDDAEFGIPLDPAALGAFGGMPATGPTTDVGA